MLAFDLNIIECCFLTVQVHQNLVHDGDEYFLVTLMMYLFAPCYSPPTHLHNQSVLLCSTKPLAERAPLY